MADTGFLYPSSTGFAVFALNTNSWTNPNNAYTSDASYATHAPTGITQYQSYGNFNISIPNGNIVTGISVTYSAKTSDNPNLLIPYVARITRGYARMAVNTYDTLSTSLTGYTQGGNGTLPTSDGAGDWVNSDLSNSEFAVLIQDDAQNHPTWTTSVDYVSVKIYYEPIKSGFLAWFN